MCQFPGCGESALKDRFCGYHWRSHARWLEQKLAAFQSQVQRASAGCVGCNTTGEVFAECGVSLTLIPCPLCSRDGVAKP